MAHTHSTGRASTGNNDIVMTAGVKVMACKYGCGGKFIVSTRTKHAPHHLECGIKAAVECSKQLHEHQGPYYDAWLSGMARWIARMRL